jgi:hypothetical protein
MPCPTRWERDACPQRNALNSAFLDGAPTPSAVLRITHHAPGGTQGRPCNTDMRGDQYASKLVVPVTNEPRFEPRFAGFEERHRHLTLAEGCALTWMQASTTARIREVLERTFGVDWRSKVVKPTAGQQLIKLPSSGYRSHGDLHLPTTVPNAVHKISHPLVRHLKRRSPRQRGASAGTG